MIATVYEEVTGYRFGFILKFKKQEDVDDFSGNFMSSDVVDWRLGRTVRGYCGGVGDMLSDSTLLPLGNSSVADHTVSRTYRMREVFIYI